MAVTVYHNPKCGTSRNVLEFVRQNGVEPEIIEYLKTPLDKSKLKVLLEKMGVGPREVLRQKGTPYDELKLDDAKWSDDEIIDFIVKHPILLNRPIVVTDTSAKLCRPSETVLDLLAKS